jgi:hypothetical protein
MIVSINQVRARTVGRTPGHRWSMIRVIARREAVQRAAAATSLKRHGRRPSASLSVTTRSSLGCRASRARNSALWAAVLLARPDLIPGPPDISIHSCIESIQ